MQDISPSDHPTKLKSIHKVNLLQKKWRILIGVLFIVTVGVVGVYSNNASRSHIPENLVRQISFPIYFPLDVPKGLKLDDESFNVSSQLFIYKFMYESNKPLVITIQPKPVKFDESIIKNADIKSLHIGRAYIWYSGENTNTVIVSDDSLISVGAPDGIPDDVLEQFIYSLRLVPKS